MYKKKRILRQEMNELPIIIAGISCIIAGMLLFRFTKQDAHRLNSTYTRHPASKQPGVWTWIEKIERQKFSRRTYRDAVSLSQAEKALLAKTSGRLGKLAAGVLVVLGFVFIGSAGRTGKPHTGSGPKTASPQQAVRHLP